MPFSSQLRGKHALVTGGTKGIGRAVVEALLGEGVDVSYCARSVRDNDFPEQTGGLQPRGKAIGTAVDITSSPVITSWVNAAAEKFGRIDIVVANASTFSVAATRDGWMQSFEGDILGLITLIDASTPFLQEADGQGAIVVVGSLAGFEARHYAVAGPYTTLKRAQSTLAKDYSRKLSPLGVRINCVVPGMIETPGAILPDGTQEQSRFAKRMTEDPDFMESILKTIPLDRPGSVQELANAAIFLSSPLSSYTTGTILIVDGGASTFL